MELAAYEADRDPDQHSPRWMIAMPLSWEPSGARSQSGTKESTTSIQYSGRIVRSGPISAAPAFPDNSIDNNVPKKE